MQETTGVGAPDAGPRDDDWSPFTPLSRFARWCERRLDRLTQGRWWAWKVVGLATVTGMVLAAPPIGGVQNPGSPLWQFVLGNSGPQLFDPDVRLDQHVGNLTFRVFPRLIGAGLGFDHQWQFLLVQFLFGLALLWAAAKLFDEVFRSRVLAALLTIATAGTWAGATAWIETRGLFDAIAIALLALAMVTRRAWLALLLAVAAGFTDERAVIALPLVVLWQVLRPEPEGEPAADGTRSPAVTVPWRWRALLRPMPLLLMSAVLIHFGIRTWLKHRYGLHENRNRYPEDPFTQIRNYPNGLWGAFEGLWVIVLAGLATFVHRRRWTEAVLLTVGMGASLTAGVSVVDISRAIAVAWPAVPVAAIGLVGVPRVAVRKVVWVATGLCVLWPMVYAAGDQTVDWAYPLPLQLFTLVTGR